MSGWKDPEGCRFQYAPAAAHGRLPRAVGSWDARRGGGAAWLGSDCAEAPGWERHRSCVACSTSTLGANRLLNVAAGATRFVPYASAAHHALAVRSAPAHRFRRSRGGRGAHRISAGPNEGKPPRGRHEPSSAVRRPPRSRSAMPLRCRRCLNSSWRSRKAASAPLSPSPGALHSPRSVGGRISTGIEKLDLEVATPSGAALDGSCSGVFLQPPVPASSRQHASVPARTKPSERVARTSRQLPVARPATLRTAISIDRDDSAAAVRNEEAVPHSRAIFCAPQPTRRDRTHERVELDLAIRVTFPALVGRGPPCCRECCAVPLVDVSDGWASSDRSPAASSPFAKLERTVELSASTMVRLRRLRPVAGIGSICRRAREQPQAAVAIIGTPMSRREAQFRDRAGARCGVEPSTRSLGPSEVAGNPARRARAKRGIVHRQRRPERTQHREKTKREIDASSRVDLPETAGAGPQPKPILK